MIVAAVQISSTSDKKENYKKVARFVRTAAGDGAKLIVLPEHWDWLGKPEDKKEIAEPLHGESIRSIQNLAKECGVIIIAGSITESNGEHPPYNTSVVVHADGMVGRIYRKIHLFDTAIPGHIKESDYVTPGNEVVVEGLGLATIGMSICYDVRFPELYRQLAKQGADIVVVPSNFTAYTGAFHWEVLVRARSIENQCFVIAADQTGVTGAGWEAHGHSMIVDPWGAILSEAGKEECFIKAELDLNRLKEIRAQMPVHTHRKLG